MADRAKLQTLLQALSGMSPTASVADLAQAERPQDYAVPLAVRPATMRAPTTLERLRGMAEQGAAAVADQPLAKMLDLLMAGGGIRALADAQSPPLFLMGAANKKPVPNPIRAWHGTPHTFAPEPDAPLGRFRADKIGTGEGAQAYGHGHYLAEARPTAEQYRKDLTAMRVGSAARALERSGGVDEAIAETGRRIEQLRALPNKGGDAERWSRQLALHEETLSELNAIKRGNPSKGSTYEANIHADPQSFLDWDKPLSQQPVGAKLRPYVVRETEPSDSNWLVQVNGRIVNGFKTKKAATEYAQTMTGADLQTSLQNQRGIDASTDLRDAGIPGIKYLDQGSRQAGQGTSNYVVFPGNEHLIEILKKYGILPFIAGAGMARKNQ